MPHPTGPLQEEHSLLTGLYRFTMVVYGKVCFFFNSDRQYWLNVKIIFSYTTIIQVFTNKSEVSTLPAGCAVRRKEVFSRIALNNFRTKPFGGWKLFHPWNFYFPFCCLTEKSNNLDVVITVVLCHYCLLLCSIVLLYTIQNSMLLAIGFL